MGTVVIHIDYSKANLAFGICLRLHTLATVRIDGRDLSMTHALARVSSVYLILRQCNNEH